MINRRRYGISNLLAITILIATTLSVGAFLFAWSIGVIKVGTSTLQVEVSQAVLRIDGSNAYLTINIKNTGSKALIGAYAYGYDDNGKKFTLALPPISPGESGGNSLTIPLGQSNLVLDASGNDYHGWNYGGYGTWVNGKVGYGMKFTSTNGLIQLPPNVLTTLVYDELSIVSWIYPYSIRPSAVFTTTDPGWGWWGYDFSLRGSGRMEFALHTGSRNNIVIERRYSSYTISSNSWTCVGAWYSNSQDKASFYKNGNYYNTVSYTRITNPSDGGRGRIGGEDGTGNEWGLNGVIDELVIYDRLLSNDEFKFLYEHPGMPPTNSIVLWYTLDEGNGNPYSFTVGKTYSIIIVYYSQDGSVKEISVAIQAQRI